MHNKITITPCLWFDGKAEEAVRFYSGIFPNSKTLDITRYSEVAQDQHGQKPGTVMTIEFELNGNAFTAINGGPTFKFTEAVSLQINCDNQAEIDHYWLKLTEGGDPKAQQCGWLKDKYGLSWQVIPRGLTEMVKDNKSEQAKRVMAALMQMQKLDIAQLERAYRG